MIITCKECNTSFNLDANLIREGGSKVKCSICKGIFLAYPTASAKMPDTDENYSSDAETFNKHSADDESDEDLQSSYHEERFNATDAATAVSDTDIEPDLQHEDFPMTIESSTADVAADSEMFEEGETGIATKSEEKAEELSNDFSFNMEEPDEISGDIELDLDRDIEDTLPDETDMADVFAEDAKEEAEIESSLALESEEMPKDMPKEMPKDMKEPDEPVLNLELESGETAPGKTAEEQDKPSLDLSLDMDFGLDEENREESDEIPGDIELDLDRDIEDTLPDETDMADVFAEDAKEEAEIELSLALESEEMPEEMPKDMPKEMPKDMKEPDEPVLNLELESGKTASGKTEEVSDNIELELEFDEEQDGEDSIKEEIADHDEIDLSDIENMLDLENGMDLDEGDDEDIEDIDLKLDMDVEEENSPETCTDADEVDSLDLEDLEQMLGGAEESDAEDEGEEVEIDLGMDSDVDDITENEEAIDATLSLNLEEIENMLDMDDTSNQDMESEEATGEIDLELYEDTNEKQNVEDRKSEEKFDVTMEVDEPDAETALDETALDEIPSDGGDKMSETIKLEFDLDESDKADLYKKHVPDEEDSSEHDKAEAVAADTKSMSDQAIEAEAAAGTDAARKKRVNKPALVLLILVLFTGGTYGAYTLMESRGIKIPYVSDFFKSGINSTVKKVADLPYIRDMFKAEKEDTTGTLKITPIENTITGKYFSNTKAGEIFVIQGKVKNNYDHPRSFIRVKANLFSTGGVLAKTGIAYSGNMLSDIDIENLDLNIIRKRLMNRNGDRKSNVNLKQGATIPFMVVFSDLPENMNMFNVEAEGSAP
ncbi:MAG: zinc-ribbon domain-containing protein [Desulfosarcina sp.]|nr:zinc-ribbon domain-containing protein [Desulfobacterales bacterium]